MERIMARVAPIDMSENVRTPAGWPLRLRWIPTQQPSSMLSTSLNTAPMVVTRSERMSAVIWSMKSIARRAASLI